MFALYGPADHRAVVFRCGAPQTKDGVVRSAIAKPQEFGLFSSEIATSLYPPAIMPKFGAMSSAMCLPAARGRGFSQRRKDDRESDGHDAWRP